MKDTVGIGYSVGTASVGTYCRYSQSELQEAIAEAKQWANEPDMNESVMVWEQGITESGEWLPVTDPLYVFSRK